LLTCGIHPEKSVIRDRVEGNDFNVARSAVRGGWAASVP
jgi:hypothetical protein